MAKRKKGKKSKKDKKSKKKRKGEKKAAGRAKAPARNKARAKAASKAGSLEAFARKIIKATSQPDVPLRELYAENCTSTEGNGQTVTGIAGLEEKLRRWESIQSGSQWNARNVWTGKNQICIEWEGVVNFRDGRRVNLSEIAVHEIKDGKIVAERYYYNPAALAPPASGGTS
jgi:hypothetical protein